MYKSVDDPSWKKILSYEHPSIERVNFGQNQDSSTPIWTNAVRCQSCNVGDEMLISMFPRLVHKRRSYYSLSRELRIGTGKASFDCICFPLLICFVSGVLTKSDRPLCLTDAVSPSLGDMKLTAGTFGHQHDERLDLDTMT